MLYPFGWLTPDLQAAPKAQPPTSEPPGVNQQKSRPLVELVNAPQVVQGDMQVAFSDNRLALAPGQTTPSLAGPLRLGSQGEVVRLAQTRLQRLAYYPGPIDGLFGPLTHQAVQDFQRAERLRVDGVIGPATWVRLVGQGPGAAIAPPAVPAPMAHPSPSVTLAGPTFSAIAVPQLSFHPMALEPAGANPKTLWLTVLSLGGAGLVALAFKPNRPAQPQGVQPRSSRGQGILHVPQPVYPARQAAGTTTIHQPQPVYPGQPAKAEVATGSPLVLVGSGDLPLPTPEIKTTPPPDGAALTLAGAVTAAWPTEAMADYLPGFLFDIMQPYSRQQLEAMIQGQGLSPEGHPMGETPILSALLQRVGAFPERNYRTGQAYTYRLLDDVGGCFRLCGNELWVTHMARRWLQEEVPYTAIIRRIDVKGRVLDKEFTVALNRHQLELAS